MLIDILTGSMEEQWFVPIKTNLYAVHLVSQMFALNLIFANMRPVRKICKTQWMIEITPILLDEYVCLPNFDSNDGVGLNSTFFEVERA